MAQHFLLSAKVRELSMVKIMMISDIEAFELFKNIRWVETNGKPIYPYIVYNNIELGSTIHADEHTGYDAFHLHFDMQRVNHSIEFIRINEKCNNQAESYNSRFRRM